MADEWGALSSSDTPHTPRDGTAGLVKRLGKIEREFRDVKNELLKAAGLSVEPGMLRVLGSLASTDDTWEMDGDGNARFEGDTFIGGNLEVTSDVELSGDTTIGGGLEVSADAEFSGDTDITGELDVTGNASFGGTMNVTGDAVFSGDLAVPNGSITNDALASPVTARVASPGRATTWSASGSWSTKASTSISVPSGFSQAMVFAMSSVTAVGTVTRFDIRTVIGSGSGSVGPEIENLTDGVAATSVPHSRSLTGLSGGSITISSQVMSAPNLSSHTGNIAVITGFAIFFR